MGTDSYAISSEARQLGNASWEMSSSGFVAYQTALGDLLVSERDGTVQVHLDLEVSKTLTSKAEVDELAVYLREKAYLLTAIVRWLERAAPESMPAVVEAPATDGGAP